MRIGIDAHMLGDLSGGNESYYTNILQSMEPQEGTEMFLFVYPETDISAYADKFTIVHFQSKNAFVRNFWELPILCRKYSLTILHTQYFVPFFCSCPLLCTIHDICFEHYHNIFTKREFLCQKLLIPYAAKHSQYIFTVSEHAKNDIIEHYHIPDEKVVVTYNAVNGNFRILNEMELEEEKLRKQFSIGNSAIILSVGNLQPRKNLPRLIKAFVTYKAKTHKDIKLVIVGKKAWMYNEIIKAAMESSDAIIFTDYVENKDLVRLYNAAECFIYPSFFEGFGIPPLEAMACGTPVAVAAATSLPEVVGDAGIYFNPFSEKEIEEAIKQLMESEEIRTTLQEKAKERVKEFSWKNSAQIIQSYYKKLETVSIGIR